MSIGYRRTIYPGGVAQHSYWQLSVKPDHRLYRTLYSGNSFTTPLKADVISDGINSLGFEYSVDGTEATKVVPPDKDPKMFYVVFVDFSVTCRSSTVALGSAVSTLNIKGQEVIDPITGLSTGEVR